MGTIQSDAKAVLLRAEEEAQIDGLLDGMQMFSSFAFGYESKCLAEVYVVGFHYAGSVCLDCI